MTKARTGFLPFEKSKFVSCCLFICGENLRRSGILPLPDCPRFCRLMKTGNRKYPRSSWMDGDKIGESEIAGLQYPRHASFNFWRTFHFRSNQRENCGDYPIYLGRSAKTESPDRLGFSRHMKTRLYSAKVAAYL